MIQGVGGVGSTYGMSQMRQALFRRLDVNSDGVIDKTELQAALESRSKTNTGHAGKASLDKIIAALDTNKDGVISQSEYNAAMSKSALGGDSSLTGATSWLVDLMSGSNAAAAQSYGVQGTTQTALRSYAASCQATAPLSTQGFTRTV